MRRTTELTNIRQDLVDREKAGEKADLIHPCVLTWDAWLAIFCSTNEVIWRKELKLCMLAVSSFVLSMGADSTYELCLRHWSSMNRGANWFSDYNQV